MYNILVINPGSTSTKVGLFKNESFIFKETLRHSAEETSADFAREEQAAFRRRELISLLEGKSIDTSSLSAIVVRGGLLKPGFNYRPAPGL